MVEMITLLGVLATGYVGFLQLRGLKKLHETTSELNVKKKELLELEIMEKRAGLMEGYDCIECAEMVALTERAIGVVEVVMEHIDCATERLIVLRAEWRIDTLLRAWVGVYGAYCALLLLGLADEYWAFAVVDTISVMIWLIGGVAVTVAAVIVGVGVWKLNVGHRWRRLLGYALPVCGFGYVVLRIFNLGLSLGG